MGVSGGADPQPEARGDGDGDGGGFPWFQPCWVLQIWGCAPLHPPRRPPPLLASPPQVPPAPVWVPPRSPCPSLGPPRLRAPGVGAGGARARSPAWAAASRDPTLGRVGLTCPVPHPSIQPPGPVGTSQSRENRGSATLGESGRRRRVSRCRGTSPRHPAPQSAWHRPTRCHRIPRSSGGRNGAPKVPRAGGSSPGSGPTGAGHVPAPRTGPGGSDLFTGRVFFLFISWRYF